MGVGHEQRHGMSITAGGKNESDESSTAVQDGIGAR